MTMQNISSREPRHVAIIMDGNGRWAKERGLDRSEGHIQGVQALYNIVKEAPSLGIEYLTIYAFSTENWVRPTSEVDHLMELFAESLVLYTEELAKNGVRLLAIGDLERLPKHSQEELARSIERTAMNKRLTLVIALSYSARYEINKAFCRCFMEKSSVDSFLFPQDPYANPIEPYLETYGLPDPDLLIRTGGEKRLSNFLLYQVAYTELYFTDCLWPDFGVGQLKDAIKEFSHRERRFGDVTTK